MVIDGSLRMSQGLRGAEARHFMLAFALSSKKKLCEVTLANFRKKEPLLYG